MLNTKILNTDRNNNDKRQCGCGVGAGVLAGACQGGGEEGEWLHECVWWCLHAEHHVISQAAVA